MSFEADIDLEKLRAAENEAAYWKQMEVVAKKQTAYWKRKTELLEPQVQSIGELIT
ncbi:MAG: hypothetical protein KAJ93_02460 [Methanosarcinales archaeon]|nr:hypothetical protein [Methanosarcinales archaeon]